MIEMPHVLQETGESDRRWVVIADDGRTATLGRARDLSDEEIARVEDQLRAAGIGGWLAVQSHSVHRAPPPTYICVRRLGPRGTSFEEAVAAVRATNGAFS